MADLNDIYGSIISPNGGLYKPGPEVVFPSSGGGGLTSRSVKTVAIDPTTGFPTDALAEILLAGSAGSIPGARGNVSTRAAITAPNQPSGTIVADKDQSRLTPNAFGYGTNGAMGGGNEAVAAIERAAKPNYGNYVATARPAALMAQPAQSSGGGLMARRAPDQGIVLRNPNVDPWAGMRGPADIVAQKQAARQQRTSGGGLMGQSAPSSPSAFGTSPSQGQAMIVSPGTSTGSTLESMGFSSGGAVPAATIRALSERGYI